jgi:hypothetical protein
MANVTGFDLLIGDRLARHFPALPRDIATCIYYTGVDPFTKKEVSIARNLRDRKLQRALLQFFKPENYIDVRRALEEAGRTDLIGGGCDALIPAHPPKEALRARRDRANRAAGGDHVHTIPNPKRSPRGNDPEPRDEDAASCPRPQTGYRPQRKTARRRNRRTK